MQKSNQEIMLMIINIVLLVIGAVFTLSLIIITIYALPIFEEMISAIPNDSGNHFLPSSPVFIVFYAGIFIFQIAKEFFLKKVKTKILISLVINVFCILAIAFALLCGYLPIFQISS